jgi:DNA-binding transcriptional ArsR family regulator
VTIVEDDLSLTFAALADPTRRAILGRLAGGDATVNQLAEPFAMTQQAISKHLKVLERAGLISRSRAAQRRPCTLETERLDAAAEWIGRHRRMWQERYDRLDEHLAALRRQPGQQGTGQQGTGRQGTGQHEPGQQVPTQQAPTQQESRQQAPRQQEGPTWTTRPNAAS